MGLLTSESGTKGGPEGMSAAFVPGRILLDDPSSLDLGSLKSCTAFPPLFRGSGDFGPVCTSGKGGGLGRRGDVEGERLPAGATAEAIN